MYGNEVSSNMYGDEVSSNMYGNEVSQICMAVKYPQICMAVRYPLIMYYPYQVFWKSVSWFKSWSAEGGHTDSIMISQGNIFLSRKENYARN
jgi:hypothetical protein